MGNNVQFNFKHCTVQLSSQLLLFSLEYSECSFLLSLSKNKSHRSQDRTFRSGDSFVYSAISFQSFFVQFVQTAVCTLIKNLNLRPFSLVLDSMIIIYLFKAAIKNVKEQPTILVLSNYLGSMFAELMI